MKKILFATSALVATAGMAAADVGVTGSAEVGVVGGGRYNDVSQLWTSIDIDFNASGETDSGLSFGANVEIDEAGASAGTTESGETYFISFGGARLNFGDTDGAFDAALTEVGIVGTIDDSETWHAGYSGNSGLDGTYDGQIATIAYTFSSFSAFGSIEIDDTGVGEPVYGVGASYSGDLGGTTLGIGVGFQTADVGAAADTRTISGVSVTAGLAAGLDARVNFSQQSRDSWAADETYTAIGLGYEINSLEIGVNYGVFEDENGVSGDTDTGYAISASYDLGGGMKLVGGFGSQDTENGAVNATSESFSFGASMSF